MQCTNELMCLHPAAQYLRHRSMLSAAEQPTTPVRASIYFSVLAPFSSFRVKGRVSLTYRSFSCSLSPYSPTYALLNLHAAPSVRALSQ